MVYITTNKFGVQEAYNTYFHYLSLRWFHGAEIDELDELGVLVRNYGFRIPPVLNEEHVSSTSNASKFRKMVNVAAARDEHAERFWNECVAEYEALSARLARADAIVTPKFAHLLRKIKAELEENHENHRRNYAPRK